METSIEGTKIVSNEEEQKKMQLRKQKKSYRKR